MIEDNPFALDHSEVHSVKPDFEEGDITHLGTGEKRARHATTSEYHTREGGLFHICAREIASFHQDIHETEPVEISRRE